MFPSTKPFLVLLTGTLLVTPVAFCTSGLLYRSLVDGYPLADRPCLFYIVKPSSVTGHKGHSTNRWYINQITFYISEPLKQRNIC